MVPSRIAGALPGGSQWWACVRGRVVSGRALLLRVHWTIALIWGLAYEDRVQEISQLRRPASRRRQRSGLVIPSCSASVSHCPRWKRNPASTHFILTDMWILDSCYPPVSEVTRIARGDSAFRGTRRPYQCGTFYSGRNTVTHWHLQRPAENFKNPEPQKHRPVKRIYLPFLLRQRRGALELSTRRRRQRETGPS